jgi:hypothetical protein
VSKFPEPLSNYTDRFYAQYAELNLENCDIELFEKFINDSKGKVNNLLMSGLGSCTLLLRLSAVINLSLRLEEGTDEEDILLMRQILDNIRETLPTDSNWKNILSLTTRPDSPWKELIVAESNQRSLMDLFVTFRNKYVHENIQLRQKDSETILSSIQLLKTIIDISEHIFEKTSLTQNNGKYFFKFNAYSNKHRVNEVSLHPFVQAGSQDGLPYIFQGLYDNKETAEIISTYYGDIERQRDTLSYDEFFEPILESQKSGTGKVFDHSDRISFYQQFFVGREHEIQLITDWIKDGQSGQNILPIYSQAGMGKGALTAEIIRYSQENHIPILYHYCSSGLANNLHAVLYHLILQGKGLQIWDIADDEVRRKLKRPPGKFHDLINFFHNLLDDHLLISRKNEIGNVVIILDALDEAAVAYPEFNIADYFQEFNDEGKATQSWKSSSNIKWVFTYREGFYNFPEFGANKSIAEVQPLLGLDENSVHGALEKFEPSKEFIEAVIERGKIT